MIPVSFSVAISSLSGAFSLGGIVGWLVTYHSGAVRRGSIVDNRQIEQDKFDDSVLKGMSGWYNAHPSMILTTQEVQKLFSPEVPFVGITKSLRRLESDGLVKSHNLGTMDGGPTLGWTLTDEIG